MTDSAVPRLAPPGAGLPFLEGLFLRFAVYPWTMLAFDWRQALAGFEKEAARILTLAESLSSENFFKTALVHRLTGMEDSSRNWSVAMTLEHLIVTMRGMTQIAETLAAGKPLNVSVSTAAVKPKGGTTLAQRDILTSFKNAAAEAQARLLPFADTVSSQHKVSHPFFGAIPAKGWVWTLHQHQVLHRKQIEEIIKTLNISPLADK